MVTQALNSSAPAPRGNWLLGHSIPYTRDPLGFLNHCAREYGGIVPLRLAGTPVLFINHPDCVEEVFSHQNRAFMRKGTGFQMVAKPFLGNGLFLSEGKLYQQQRTLVQPAFHRQMLTAYGEIMVYETQTIMDAWQAGEVRDIYQDYVNITRTIVAKTMFGIRLEAEVVDAVTEALNQVMNRFKNLNEHLLFTPSWLPTPNNLSFNRAINRLDQTIYKLLQQYQSQTEGEPNFLDMLLQAQDTEEPITLQKVRDEVVNIFLAGYETTAIALTWLSWILSQHPHVEAKLFEELQTILQGRTPTVADIPQLLYTEAVVLETLRLYPPVWALVRVAVEETTILGYPVPKGMNVMACQWTAHRNPQFFPEPETFNPDRWTNGLAKQLPMGAYFPFSLGGRVCLGKAFGMMELVLVLATITQKFQFKSASARRVEFFLSITLRPKEGIKLAQIRR